MKKQATKKHSSPGVLWSLMTAMAFLLMPTTSLAGYYVLNFKTPKTNVKVFLSVEPDTETDGPPEAQGLQEQSSGLLSSENEQPETIGGLQVSESTPGDHAKNQECGALSSPVFLSLTDSDDETGANASTLPLTTQPDIASTHSIHPLETGTATVTTWLQRGMADDSTRFYEIPSSRLKAFVLMLARLVAMEAHEMYTCSPSVRCRSFICDSDINPSWYIGRIATFTMFLGTSSATALGFIYGTTAMGAVSLATGVFCNPFTVGSFSYARFPNQFQVSFAFNSNSLVVSEGTHNLQQQIVDILKFSGGYNLVAFSYDPLEGHSARQTLTFNVRVPDSINAKRLQGILEQRNHQSGHPFQIEVSSIDKPSCNPPTSETSL